jgi:uncharacterized protein (DUF302 family)
MARRVAAALLLLALLVPAGAPAQTAAPHPGTRTVSVPHAFEEAWRRLEAAIGTQDIRLLAVTSPNENARAMGVELPGSAVFMVFHPRLAIRMLQAHPPAGIEAPVRLYLYEGDEGTRLTWRTAESLFAPYGVPALAELGREIDGMLEEIARRAAAPG